MSDSQNSSNYADSSIKSLLDKQWATVTELVENISRIKQQNGELLRRNNTLEQSLGDKDSSFYEIVNQKSELEIAVHNLNKKNKELEKIISDQNEKISRIDILESELVEIRSSFTELENQNFLISEKASFITNLNDELTLEKEKNFNLIHEKNDLLSKLKLFSDTEKNLSLVSKELAHKNLLLNERALEIEKLKDRIAELENLVYRNKQTEELLAEQISKNMHLQNDFDDFRLTSESEYLKLVESNKDLKIIITELEETASNQKDESSYYTTQISELNAQLSMKSDEVMIIKTQISDYEAKIISLEDEIRETKRVYDETNTRNKIDSIQSNVDLQYDSALAIKEIEIRALTAKLEQLESTIQPVDNIEEIDYQDEYEQLKEEFHHLEFIYNELKDLYDYEKSKSNDILNDNYFNELENNYKNRINQLEENINNYRVEFAQKLMIIEELTFKIDELKGIISNLSEQLITKESELTAFAEKSEDNSELDYYKSSKIVDLETIIGNLQNQNKILELSINSLRERGEDLEDLVKTRYEQINLLEEQINELLAVDTKSTSNNSVLVARIDDYIKFIDSKLAIS